MALHVGTIYAELKLQDGAFTAGLAQAKTGMEQTAQQAGRAGDQAGKNFGTKLGAGLNGAAAQAGQAGAKAGSNFGGGLSAAVDRTTRQVGSKAAANLGQAGDQAGRTFGQKFSASASSSLQSASRELSSRLGNTFTPSVAGIGVAAGAALGGALMKGWSRLTAIDDAKAKLSGLHNSAENVSVIMGNAMSSVKGTAFGMDAAATTAAGAVAAGIKPGKELERVLKLTGDAATIAGVGMGEMGAIFNKVAASNKIQGDVINQLNDAGIPIVQLLGAELGKTAEETIKMASDGEVGFAAFANAMEKGLGGAALKSGETVSGAMKNMGAAVSRFGALLAQPVFTAAPVVFGGITEGLDGAGKAVKSAGGMFSGLPAPVQNAALAFAAFKVGSLALGSSLGGKLTSPLREAAAGVTRVVTATGGIAQAGQHGAVQMGRFGSSISALGQHAPVIYRMQDSFMKAAVGADRFGRTAGIASAGMTAIKSAGSGLVSFLGGPFGIGLMAAAAAVAIWMQRTANIKKHNEELGTAAKGVATSLSEIGSATTLSADEVAKYGQQAGAAALEQAKMAVSGKSLAETLKDIGVNGALAAQGLAGNKKAAEDTLAALKAKADAEADQYKDRASNSGLEQLNNVLHGRPAEDRPKSEAWKDYQKLLDEVKAQQDAIKREAENGGFKLNVAEDGTVALGRMAEAMKKFESNTAGAASSVDILAKALQGLTDDEFTTHDAQAKVNAGWREMKELAGTLGNVGLDKSGLIDTATAEGAKADSVVRAQSENYKQLAASMFEAGVRGSQLTQALEPQYQQFLKSAEAMGLTKAQAESVAKELGLIPTDTTANVNVKIDANAKQTVDAIGDQFKSFDGKTSTITVKSMTEEAQGQLTSLGWTVEQIPGSKEVRLTPKTAEAQAAFDTFRGTMFDIPAVKAVTIETPGYQGVMAGLGELGIKVHSDNEKHIVIDDNSPEVRQRLAELNVKTTTLKDGTVVISDNSIDVRNRIDRELNGKQTQSTHTVAVKVIGRADALREQGLPTDFVGPVYQRPQQADGSIRQRADGMLDTAHIAQGRGQGIVTRSPLGPVQYAEGETGWEAFIPGAPSKRGRSTNILRETARRMGFGLVKMADGGTRTGYASAIVTEAYRRGLDDKAAKIALATALVESNMQMYANNADPESLNYPHDAVGSDHDSSGLFQQRNNGAWGTIADRMDPTRSAGMFYDQLAQMDYHSMDEGAAAQAVQRSAFPGKYAERMVEAQELLDEVKAYGPESLAEAQRSSASTSSEDGQPVYVTNWPTGMGGSLSDAVTAVQSAPVPPIAVGGTEAGGPAPAGAGGSEPLANAIDGIRSLVERGDFTPNLRDATGLEEDSPLVAAVLDIRKAIGMPAGGPLPKGQPGTELERAARDNPPTVDAEKVKTPQQRMAEWAGKAGPDLLEGFGLPKPGGFLGALMGPEVRDAASKFAGNVTQGAQQSWRPGVQIDNHITVADQDQLRRYEELVKRLLAQYGGAMP
ncbi:tape measure protein [Rhodococcus sp. NPDC127528]|uniref:tape measure protein n=1 Tax=unclassified Rhodococcus (in: high G+C Gram-positive bacteria) TaxID=192944 RepID=UPI00362CAE60